MLVLLMVRMIGFIIALVSLILGFAFAFHMFTKVSNTLNKEPEQLEELNTDNNGEEQDTTQQDKTEL